MSANRELHCPSARAEMPGAVIHGVVDAASGHILPLEEAVPVTAEWIAATAPLPPARVLRFSAPCAEGACGHYTGSACSLVARLVQIVPISDTPLQRCVIRSTCRWFAEAGRAACLRCDSIVTDELDRGDALSELGTPRPEVMAQL